MPPAVLRILAVLVASTSVAACGGADDNDGGSLTVFAASSLSEVADSLAGAFTDSSPEIDHMEVQSGGSDSLARLIVDGAPADALLTADLSTMDLLADLPVDPVVVANNRAALVVPEDNPAGIESVTDLADPTVILAACEPVVPCGDAALELFEQAGIQPAPAPATLEPNVRSVLTKVELGEVDAGVVYRTDAARSSSVRSIPVADPPRRPVAAAAVSDRDAADAFIDFLQSDEAAAIFAMHGFEDS